MLDIRLLTLNFSQHSNLNILGRFLNRFRFPLYYKENSFLIEFIPSKLSTNSKFWDLQSVQGNLNHFLKFAEWHYGHKSSKHMHSFLNTQTKRKATLKINHLPRLSSLVLLIGIFPHYRNGNLSLVTRNHTDKNGISTIPASHESLELTQNN